MQYLNPEEAKEFLAVHNALAEALKLNPKFAAEGYYAYRVTEKGYLHRQPKAHCFNNKWTNYSSCYENAKRAKERRGQKKLLPLLTVETKPTEKLQ
jgi:hypothetical protein